MDGVQTRTAGKSKKVFGGKNLVGIFFIKKKLNKALGGTHPNRLSNMEPYKKAPAEQTGACDYRKKKVFVITKLFQ